MIAFALILLGMIIGACATVCGLLWLVYRAL